MDMTIGIIALAFLIVLSGLFSGVEAAFLSLTKIKIRRLVELKKKNANIVGQLKDDSHKLIITLLIGNNLVNIGASAIATAVAIDIFESAGVGIATGVMTFMILVFGEIIPKSLAIQHAQSICLVVARPVRFLEKILYPLIVIFNFITRKLMGRMAKGKKQPEITEEELRSFVEIGAEAGTIESDEREMIHNIFRLNDLEVREIMTPKINMQTIDGDSFLRNVLDYLTSSRRSRIPVYQGAPDKIIGIIIVRELLSKIKDQNFDIPIRDLMRPALIVPGTKKVDDLLKEMQKKIQHISIVVDEYGVVTGLVTIEDILEEIVGEIYDESDLIEQNILKLDKSTSRVKGETSIDELNRVLKVDLEMSNGYDTISGYVLKEVGRIPNQGEKIELPEFTVHIDKVKDNRIAELKLVRK